ncbi:MAG TPA: GFA family protein [Micropepsaceae bacterium]|nr:GFA family protein [Micropepsaceae bacterium]
MRKQYFGQCHCGKVTYTVKADLETERNGICNCSNCTMKGFLHHHVEKARFTLLTGFDDLKLYKFGTLSAEHYFCKSCGVESFYRSRSDPDMWDINVRCLKHADTRERVDIYALTYQLGDGEHWEDFQKARHQGGIFDRAKPWHLIAPAECVPSNLDVAAEFKKTWAPDGDSPAAARRGRRTTAGSAKKRAAR